MLIILLFCFCSQSVFGRIIIDISSNITSYAEKITGAGSNPNKYSNSANRFSLTSEIDGSGKYRFGFNYEILSRTYGKDTLSLTNMGPKIDMFSGPFYLTLAWFPYSQGKRKIGADTETISGWGYLAGVGYVKKITKVLSVGGSFNYASLSVTKKTTAANVTSKVTESYSFMYPMLEFKLSFR